MIRRIPKLLVSVFVYALDNARDFLGGRLGKEPKGRAVVLYYHAVRDQDREHFARQMEMLARRARPFSVESSPRMEGGGLYAAVTFDDGFACVARNAVPELAARKIPVMIFVPAASLGGPPSWISDTGHPDSSEIVMSEEDLRELARIPGVSIGSHCLTHRNLMNLDVEESRREIRESKNRLEAIIGKEVSSISFPHGAFDDRYTAIAYEVGYKHLFSISPTLYLEIDKVKGRVRVEPSDWPLEFHLKLAGAYRWFHAVSSMKRKMLGQLS
jgi:peptidoglycan/xylan/chitin deacetylase (PgdA/CDA1 family)